MGVYLKLLGGPVVLRRDGGAVRIPTRKSQAILAYLAERRQDAVSREVLASLLWPYSAEEQSRASLRQEISALRKALGPDLSDLIVTTGDRISLAAQDIDADIWRIRDCPAGAEPNAVVELLEYYTAPFLDTFRIRSQPFSDWVWATRQDLETRIMSLGQNALHALENDCDDADAVNIAMHLCRIDPTFEPAHRTLISRHLRSGDVTAAKKQLKRCEVALKSDLDAEVSQQTLMLFETVKPAGSASEPAARQLLPDHTPSMEQRRRVAAMSVVINPELEDPEDFDAEAREIIALVRARVEANSGMLLQMSEDQILACFGYPAGHDKDPDTAVLTALDILDTLSARQNGHSNCQIGLAFGEVVVSTGSEGNIKMSSPVLRAASKAAYRGGPSTVNLDPKAEEALFSGHVLNRLNAVTDNEYSLERAHADRAPDSHGVAGDRHPMIGREEQLNHLVELLEQAKLGQGAAIGVLGEPGQGKSRLVQECQKRAISIGFEIRVLHGTRVHRHTTFAPVIDQIFPEGLSAASPLSSADVLDRLHSISPELSLAAPYFEHLIDIRDADIQPGASASDSAKEAALDIFAALIDSLASDRPTLLIFEDIQWFDPTTCEAIARMIDTVQRAPVVAIMVSRNDEAPDIVKHPFVRRIELNPLQPLLAETLLRGLLAGAVVTDELIQNVLQRAEGNPLILEEFAKSIRSRQARADLPADLETSPRSGGDGKDIATPDRLVPLLLSRIDSVPGAIQVLQVASVLGRKFGKNQLLAVLQPTTSIASLVSAVEDAGIIFASRRGDDAFYIFNHALVADAIYSTIPKRDRPALHFAVAEMLLTDDRSIPHSEAAHHFRAAADFERAAQHFEMSGDRAAKVSANAEAISEYREAMAMIARLPGSRERVKKELALNRKTAAQFVGLSGILPSQKVIEHYARARSLSEKLGDAEEIVNTSWALWGIQLLNAEMDQCLETADGVGPHLRQFGSAVDRIAGHYMLGVTHAYRGSLQLASDHLGALQDAYSGAFRDEILLRFGLDINLASYCYRASVFALLGQVENADRAVQQALLLAGQNKDGLSLIFAHVFAATKCLLLDQIAEARHYSQRALEDAEALKFRQWVAQANIQLARIADLSGDGDALKALQAARDDYLATGMVLARPLADLWIADAQIRIGRRKDALETLDALRTYTANTQQCYLDSVADRIRSKAVAT